MVKKKSELRSIQRRIAGVTTPITRKRTRWNRNWQCLCGSGKKFKRCCMKDTDAITEMDDNAMVDQLPEDIQKLIDVYQKEK